MRLHYFVRNNHQGCWGRAETLSEAIANSRFTQDGDTVEVFLANPEARANAAGVPMGRFGISLGIGKVHSRRTQVQLALHETPARATVADHLLVGLIHDLLDGVEWSPDTLEGIAGLLRTHGYPINDPDDEEDA